MGINVRYYEFHLCYLPVAAVLVTFGQATTAYEQQHETDTNFYQGFSIGEVNV
jgi:hypothetical protein